MASVGHTLRALDHMAGGAKRPLRERYTDARRDEALSLCCPQVVVPGVNDQPEVVAVLERTCGVKR